jgi:hypothetical protein
MAGNGDGGGDATMTQQCAWAHSGVGSSEGGVGGGTQCRQRRLALVSAKAVASAALAAATRQLSTAREGRDQDRHARTKGD